MLAGCSPGDRWTRNFDVLS